MSARREVRNVEAIDAWGKRLVYRARIVNSETGAIVVRSSRSLAVGKRISFLLISDLHRTDSQRTPPWHKWRSGVIWRIDKGYLHLTRT